MSYRKYQLCTPPFIHLFSIECDSSRQDAKLFNSIQLTKAFASQNEQSERHLILHCCHQIHSHSTGNGDTSRSHMQHKKGIHHHILLDHPILQPAHLFLLLLARNSNTRIANRNGNSIFPFRSNRRMRASSLGRSMQNHRTTQSGSNGMHQSTCKPRQSDVTLLLPIPQTSLLHLHASPWILSRTSTKFANSSFSERIRPKDDHK